MRMRKGLGKSVVVEATVDGFVDGPASEVDANASYTFEGESGGRWFRWTGVRPQIVGDRAHFNLRDGQPIEAPENAN